MAIEYLSVELSVRTSVDAYKKEFHKYTNIILHSEGRDKLGCSQLLDIIMYLNHHELSYAPPYSYF